MSWSRRQALSAVATSLAALSGCSASEEASTAEPTEPGENLVEDYEFERVRSADGEVLFARALEIPTPDDRDGRPAAGYNYDLLTAAEELEDYSFADVPEAEQLRAFAAATDFDSESVYLFSTFVDACHEIEIESVSVDGDGHPRGRFCQATRPADVACSTDEFHSVGYAIRLPVALDGASGQGGGMSSSCRRRPPRVSFDADVTPRGGEDE